MTDAAVYAIQSFRPPPNLPWSEDTIPGASSAEIRGWYDATASDRVPAVNLFRGRVFIAAGGTALNASVRVQPNRSMRASHWLTALFLVGLTAGGGSIGAGLLEMGQAFLPVGFGLMAVSLTTFKAAIYFHERE